VDVRRNCRFHEVPIKSAQTGRIIGDGAWGPDARAEARQEVGIVHDAPEAIGEAVLVIRVEQETVLTVPYHLRHPAKVGGNNRRLHRVGFRDHEGCVLIPARRSDDDIEAAQDSRALIALERAGDVNPRVAAA